MLETGREVRLTDETCLGHAFWEVLIESFGTFMEWFKEVKNSPLLKPFTRSLQGNFQQYIPDISQYIPGWVLPFGARLFQLGKGLRLMVEHPKVGI